MMISTDDALRAGALALALFAGGGMACVGTRRLTADPPWPALPVRRSELAAELSFLRAPLTATQVIGAQLAGTAALVLLAFAAWAVWPLFALPLVVWGPGAVIDGLATRRRRKIEEQLDGWLVTLANSLHATPSLGAALETTTQDTRGPIAQEVDRVLKRRHLGTPLEDGLAEMARRVDSRALSGAVLLMQLALRTGGNLPATLQSTAGTLREIARLEGVVRTKTAEGRGQTRLIGMLPLPLLGAVYALDPGFLAPLADSSKGHAVLAGAAVLWLCAILGARRIVQVEV